MRFCVHDCGGSAGGDCDHGSGAGDFRFCSMCYFYNIYTKLLPTEHYSPRNVPQSTVLGHSFASGFVSRSQLEVVQLTEPGVPDNPAPTPHLVAHPRGSPSTQSPGKTKNKIHISYNRRLQQIAHCNESEPYGAA